MRGAVLLGKVFTLDVGEGVFLEWNSGITALLRAIVHETVLTDIQVTGACAAFPVIGFTSRKLFLKPVKAAVALFAIALDFAVDAFFAPVQRFHRTRAVVNDAQ